MKKVFFISMLVVGTLAMSYSACAQQSVYSGICKNISGKPLAKSFEEMIQQADFIGLYEVNNFNANSSGITGDGFPKPLYSYELSLSKNLKGLSPKKYTIKVLYETKGIPKSYYYIKDIHKAIVNDDALSLGFSYEIMNKTGECQYTTELVQGYEYIIFGGANSRSIFQPILDRRFDPLYTEVVKRIRVKKKAEQPSKK